MVDALYQKYFVMLIGELSKRSGFSRDTIRFYERAGIFSLCRKQRLINNYKDYPVAVLDKLLMLKKLKQLGFTLNESTEIIAMVEENEASCDQVATAIHAKISLLEGQIKKLEMTRQFLLDGLVSCPRPDGNCPLVVH